MKLTEVGNLVLRGQIKCFTLNREWPACSLCPCFQSCEFARMFPPSEGNEPSIRYFYCYLLNQNWPVWEKQEGLSLKSKKQICSYIYFPAWLPLVLFLVRCPSGIIAHWCFWSVWHNNCVIEDELSPPAGPRTAPAVILCSLHICKKTFIYMVVVVIWDFFELLLKECYKTFRRKV